MNQEEYIKFHIGQEIPDNNHLRRLQIMFDRKHEPLSKKKITPSKQLDAPNVCSYKKFNIIDCNKEFMAVALSKNLYLRNYEGDYTVCLIKQEDLITCVKLVDDFVIFGLNNGPIKFYTLEEKRVIKQIITNGVAFDIEIGHDMISCACSNGLNIFDTRKNQVVCRVGSYIHRVKKLDYMYAMSDMRNIIIYDHRNLKVPMGIKHFETEFPYFDWSQKQHGHILYGADKLCKWNLTSNEEEILHQGSPMYDNLLSYQNGYVYTFENVIYYNDNVLNCHNGRVLKICVQDQQLISLGQDELLCQWYL